MQIRDIQNGQNFNGNVFVEGLSKKQQKVYEKIEPVIVNLLKDKNYDLFIEGNAKPDINCIHRNYKVTPRYVNFLTRPANSSKLEPHADSFSGSFNPQMWLTHVENLIIRHERSPYYTPDVKQKTFTNKIKTFFTKVFS